MVAVVNPIDASKIHVDEHWNYFPPLGHAQSCPPRSFTVWMPWNILCHPSLACMRSTVLRLACTQEPCHLGKGLSDTNMDECASHSSAGVETKQAVPPFC